MSLSYFKQGKIEKTIDLCSNDLNKSEEEIPSNEIAHLPIKMSQFYINDHQKKKV